MSMSIKSEKHLSCYAMKNSILTRTFSNVFLGGGGLEHTPRLHQWLMPTVHFKPVYLLA